MCAVHYGLVEMSVADEEERRAKQNYLRTEIIEGGFDASTFIEHLNTLKPNGDDVDEWTLEELIDAVSLFKQNQRSVLEQTSPEPASESTPGSKRTSSLSNSKRVLSESQMVALEQNKRRATMQGFVLEASDDEFENVPQGMDTDDDLETSAFEAAVEKTHASTEETQGEQDPQAVLTQVEPVRTIERRETTQIKPQGIDKVDETHPRNSTCCWCAGEPLSRS